MEPSISDELPRSTRKALAKLLDACGLENEFSGGAYFCSPSSFFNFHIVTHCFNKIKFNQGYM